jgi:drug/metabolite transporter (DMT)-like permease
VIGDPKTWRGLSSLLLVVFIAALLIGPGISQVALLALLGSGVAFAIELALGRRRAPAERE